MKIEVDINQFLNDISPLLWAFVVCVLLSILVEIITDEIKRHKENT